MSWSGKGLAVRGTLLYLTQVDPIDLALREKRQPLSGERLRSYLILQAMFFDRLVVGDSQLINNEHLRSLLWPHEASADPGIIGDLALLLKHGVLVPAIRGSAGSLHAVWRDLRARLPEVPEEQYIDFVEEHLGRRGQVSYNADNVSELFRGQVLATLDPSNDMFHVKDSVRRTVYDFVAEQDTLYYMRLRQWMNTQVSAGRMTAHQRMKVDRAVAAAYRHNVPKSISGSLIDMPLNPRDFWTPIDIRVGRASIFGTTSAGVFAAYPMRPFALSPRVLGRLRADTLITIRDDPARRRALNGLEEFRRNGQIDAERLAGDVERFLYNAEQIAYADAQGNLRDLIKARRRSRRRARLTITGGLGLAVAGLNIWGLAGDIASTASIASGYAGLVVAAWGSIKTVRASGAGELNGYMVGRALPDEHRLVQSDPHRPSTVYDK
jgi:hypothetical protein